MTVKSYQEEFKISRSNAFKELNKLTKEGFIIKETIKNKNYYSSINKL